MIDPVATAQAQPAVNKASSSAPASAPGTQFREVLDGSAPQEKISPAAAAEILRLKMLSSAVSIGEDPRRAAAGSRGVQGLLDRFLEQLPDSLKGAAGIAEDEDAPDAVCTAEAAGEDGPPASLEAIIQKASKRYGVDGGLIKAIIKAESGFNPRAVSSVGAQGLMQLMPSTARGLGVKDAFDPEQNVMAGTRFFKDMLNRYGNVDEALAAYNWGPGNVDRHGTDRLPRETRAYLGKVKGYYAQNVG